MAKTDPIIAATEFDGAVDRVDAANKAAQLGGTESEIAADSVGDWEELGYDKVAQPEDIVKVLGEVNRSSSVTVGSLKSAENIPDSGWNDPSYWGPFDSVNRDSFLAGGGEPDAYVKVYPPAAR